MKTHPIELTVTVLFTLTVAVAATPHYVNVNSTNAQPPFLDWNTAATIIQDAVDVAVAGDEVVVTNGIYAGGGPTAWRWTSPLQCGASTGRGLPSSGEPKARSFVVCTSPTAPPCTASR